MVQLKDKINKGKKINTFPFFLSLCAYRERQHIYTHTQYVYIYIYI